MTLQPRAMQKTLVHNNPRIIDDSDLFDAPSISDEEDDYDKESDLTSQKDLLPTENTSNSIYNILAKTSKVTAKKFWALKARMQELNESDDEIEIHDSGKNSQTITRSLFSNPFSSIMSRKRQTIEEDVRDRNENRIKKKLPEINEPQAIKYYKNKKNKGEMIYRRLRLDGEHEDTTSYLRRIEKEKHSGKKEAPPKQTKAGIDINKVVVQQDKEVDQSDRQLINVDSSKFSSIRFADEDDEESDSADELNVDFDEVMNNKLKPRLRKNKKKRN